MSVYVQDIGKQLLVRGNLALNLSAQQTAVTWFDLSDPGGNVGIPLTLKNSGANSLVVTVEGSWTGAQAVNVYISETDQAAGPSTVAGQCPLLHTFTAPDWFGVNTFYFRWLGFAIPVALVGGTASIFVYGVLPT